MIRSVSKLLKGKSNTAVSKLSIIKAISVKENADEHILTMLQEPASMEKGFRLLMHTYQEQVYWHIRRLVTDHDDANDIVQNVFIKVYRSIDRFEGKSKLFTWLYRIATNESLSFLEKQKRRASVSLSDVESGLENKIIADKNFDANKLEWKLQLAIQQLPEKQRIVFNLRYYDEMPYEEMSRILETSEGALKASYHHAARKIEDFIRNH